METFIRAVSAKMIYTAKEFINIKMVMCLKGNGSKEKSKGEASTEG